MENNSNESGKPRETVTLILKEMQFKVDKQKLIDKSKYFAALLSTNFLECGQTEHVINYDISPISLQDFIDWIHHDKIVFTSAVALSCDFKKLRYVLYLKFKRLNRLLILLELSVLFAADKLIKDVTDQLTRNFMSPRYAIKIWLLAQELNINVLRDLFLAVCLDRFDELPLDSICKLSRENFLKLIGNINVKATKSYLRKITHQWMNHHQGFTVSLENIKSKEAKILHGIASCEHNNREQYVHCWDGNNFFELTSFEYPPEIIKRCSRLGRTLEGMQITARRYDLYLCGGEYGIGSGKMNKNIWRYSLISKRWFRETEMPVERRHMIVVCLKNKLLLVGGVGRDKQKLKTVDIYNIHTGDFNCFIDIYFPDENVWKVEYSEIFVSEPSADVPVLTLQTMPCYIDIVDREKLVLRTITDTCNMEGCNHIMKTLPCSINRGRNQKAFFALRPLSPFFREYGEPTALLCMDHVIRDSSPLHLHSIPIRDPKKFSSLILTKNSESFTKKRHVNWLPHRSLPSCKQQAIPHPVCTVSRSAEDQVESARSQESRE
ncbi:uncharacterized protein LOC112466694 [Temnothorax curvispinosus]|uniref:Uncharacterized protein LOC112466694 n=1 Tax=Temnothorax curvispinosus TaxID=300111 RepID=A0A6J1RD23_9HYME|nr:uncharacterized protein LOC112466694 [Temnothorax curvispinosus]